MRLLDKIAQQQELPDEIVAVILDQLQQCDAQALSIFHTIHPPCCYPPLRSRQPTDCFIDLCFHIDNSRIINNVYVVVEHRIDTHKYVYNVLRPQLRKVSTNRMVNLLDMCR